MEFTIDLLTIWFGIVDFDESDCVSDLSSSFDAEREGSFSKASIKAKFRGISWGSYRKASKAKRPAVLQEVGSHKWFTL